jgi:type I restriction enzyme S subunit
LTSGSRGWAEHYSDSGKLFLRISNLTRDSINLDLSDIKLVDVPAGTEGERTRVQKGDLLISITADLGSVAIVPDNIKEAYVSQHVALARPTSKNSLSRWLGYLLISRVGKNQLEMAGLGGTKIQLALDDVRSLKVFIPPLDEQIKILCFFEKKLEKFDALYSAYSRQITLLTEYRAALIHECVTGQRVIPDYFNTGD